MKLWLAVYVTVEEGWNVIILWIHNHMSLSSSFYQYQSHCIPSVVSLQSPSEYVMFIMKLRLFWGTQVNCGVQVSWLQQPYSGWDWDINGQIRDFLLKRRWNDLQSAKQRYLKPKGIPHQSWSQDQTLPILTLRSNGDWAAQSQWSWYQVPGWPELHHGASRHSLLLEDWLDMPSERLTSVVPRPFDTRVVYYNILVIWSSSIWRSSDWKYCR